LTCSIWKKVTALIYWIGGAEAIAKLENQTGYSIFKNFVSPEQDPSGPNSNKFLGVDLKEIELSPERMKIFQNALGNSLESNVLVIGASILTTTGSQLSEPIFIQPLWLPEPIDYAEPETARFMLTQRI